MTDIFLWANNTDGVKNDLQCELFLFNKNYTPYSVRVHGKLDHQLKPVFLYGIINYVTMGAGTGLKTVELEAADKSKNILPHTPLDNVGRAETLLHLIEHERHDIVEFSHNEHDFKRVKGVVARFTHPTNKGVLFYAVKLLRAADSISSANAWQMADGQFVPHENDVTVKIPTDDQMLVVDGEIFIFNVPKFTKLFDYDAQQIIRSDEIGAIISENYKLNLPDLFNDFAVMARTSSSTLKKLLDVNTAALVDQETVIEIADEMQIELMVDDAGAIILYDHKDVSKFLDILNDNYLSSATGNHYLAKTKKPLEVAE